MKLATIGSLSLAVAGALAVLSSASRSMTPALLSPPPVDCWSIYTSTCFDCNEQVSYFCNPNAEGMFNYCDQYTEECPTGWCSQVTVRTGPPCG